MPRLISVTGAPHPIDVLIGWKMRKLRKQKGLSLANLGARLGVTFQQIQKYESGKNRIAASTLWEIASSLDVSLVCFFDLPPVATSNASGIGAMRAQSAHFKRLAANTKDAVDAADLRELARMFETLSQNPDGRKQW